MCVFMNVFICVCVYTYMCLCTLCMHACMHYVVVRAYVCLYMCVYACIMHNVCMFVHGAHVHACVGQCGPVEWEEAGDLLHSQGQSYHEASR